MKLSDAREFVRIIRLEKYNANPLEQKFLVDLEQGYRFKENRLSQNQENWLKAIYEKATNPKSRL